MAWSARGEVAYSLLLVAYMPMNTRRDRKFLLSLTWRLKGWGRERRWFWMVVRSEHKLLRTWLGLLIIVLQRDESGYFSKGECFVWKKTSPLDTSDKTVQAVQVLFAPEPPQSRRAINQSTDHCSLASVS